MQENLHVELTHVDPINFNNVPHMHNFMNYLFRTGQNQKWTNELTKNNLLFKYENDVLVSFEFDEDFTARENLKNEVYSVLMPLVRNNSERELLNDIVYLNAINLESKKEINGELSQKDLKEILKEIVIVSNKQKDEVFFVAHLDQVDSYFHIHSVFLEKEKGGW
ncbi:hypothetical protein [Sporosarcina sp. BP05]|uniref:hypothetical protein n=1 Tax=Sporosarcina sp. BP05 TaxID=2758726 RepID=UPI0016474878|nr:hypothetical protein [Sporosarcina sp. BP05]